MICWYCYWGWPREIAEIYKRAEAAIDDLESEPRTGESCLQYGPAHVVWADENWECAESCIEDCNNRNNCRDMSDTAIAIVKTSLQELASLPPHIRYAEPKDYDGENPADYPPPGGMEMVKM